MNITSIRSTLQSGMTYVATPFVQAGPLAPRVSSVALGALNWVFPRNPVNQFRQLWLIPTFVERGIGKLHYSLCSPSDAPCRDAALNEKVQNVFRRLVPHLERNLPYELQIVQNGTNVSAACWPGGKMVITTAMLTVLQMDLGDDLDKETTFEDRLAALLGHELTHAAAGHSVMGIQRAYLAHFLGHLALRGLLAVSGKGEELWFSATTWTGAAVIGLAAEIILTQFRQRAEFEADRKGMKYAARAGFNPAGAVWVQKIFLKMEGGESDTRLARVLGLLQNHPSSELRVQKAKESLELFEQRGAEAL